MTELQERPLGWILVGKDNQPITHANLTSHPLYLSLRAACDAETGYRERTGLRALPTAVFSRKALQDAFDRECES